MENTLFRGANSFCNTPKIEFDAYISYGIATNENARKELEGIIKKYDVDHITLTKGNSFLKNRLYLCSRFEIKYYYTKALACVIAAKNNQELRVELDRLLRKNWRSEYIYVTGRKNVDLLEYLNNLSMKGDFSTKGFDCLVRMYIFLYFIIKYTNQYPFQEIGFITTLIEKTSDLDQNKSVNNMFNKDRKQARIMLNVLEGLTESYFASKDLGIACPAYLPDLKESTLFNLAKLNIRIEDDSNIPLKKMPKDAEYGITKVKQLNSLITLILAKNDIDLKALNISLKKDEQLDIMLMLYKYLKANGIKLEKLNCLNELEQGYIYSDLLYLNLVLTTVSLLAKTYKEGEEFFQKNFTDGLEEENVNLKREFKLLKNEVSVLNDDKSKLLDEIERLKLENRRLSMDLDKHQDDSKELIALRNYMFNNTDDCIDTEGNTDSFDSIINDLRNVKVTIIGGNNTWISKMKEVLPEWNYVALNQANFDKNLLSVDWVIINSTQNMHKLYYKAKENCNSNFAIISKTNVRLACNAIHKIIF